MTRFSRRLLAAAVAGVLMGPTGPARAQDDFSFDIVEDQVTDTDKQRIEDARDLLAQERFAEALSALSAITTDPKMKKHHEGATYELCKGLYKMDAYHAALSCFEGILRAGPKHSQYAPSREWLFFIARNTKDELAPLELIARYAKAEDIPAEYQSELGYALGRYYFLKAMELGIKVVPVEPKPEPEAAEPAASDVPDFGEPEPTDSAPSDTGDDPGGFDFSADELGGGDGDWMPRALRARDADRVLLAQEGMDFDFGDAQTSDADKKKGGKKSGRKADKKSDKASDKKADKKADKAKVEPAPASKPAPKVDSGDGDPAGRGARSTPSSRRYGFDGPKSTAEALKLSMQNLERVKPDFALYSQALYIKGLVYLAQEQFDPSVKAFREVVRMTNPRGGTVENTKLREMAFFSLARIHYEFEQFRYAIFYYNRISRDSEQWVESLFESSWAHFRLAEYEKALGNLVTLQSPFFQDEYYPEAAILKAVTFYENCRYPEARAFIGEFEQSYGGVLQELDRLIGTSGGKTADASGGAVRPSARTATELFDELTELERKVSEGRDDASRSFALTARLLRLALSDKRVKGFREAIDELDAEKARLEALEAPFAGGSTHGELLNALTSRRGELVALAGTVLRNKLEGERKFLADLNAKLVRIQFEITKGEKETLEAKISGQTQSTGTQDYQFITAVDDERLYWPFDGEYWRDELGTYQYTLTRGCRPPSESTITGD